MSSEITAAERALIDAAIAAGRVTRVEPGASALYDYQWCPKRADIVHKDIIAGIKRPPGYYLNKLHHGGTKRRPPSDASGSKARPTGAAREAYLAQVRELHEAGVPRPEIAERLGKHYHTICDAFKALGLQPTPGVRRKRADEIEREARVRRLHALLTDGTVRTARELRAILGVKESRFWDDMKALRAQHPELKMARSMHERTAERRAAIREVLAGAGPVEPKALAERFGASLGMIYEDLRAVRRK